MLLTKKTNDHKRCWELGGGEALFTVGGNLNLCSHWGNQSGDSWEKLEIEQPYDMTVSPLSVQPQDSMSTCHRQTLAHVCIHVHSYISGSRNIIGDEVERSQNTRKSTVRHKQNPEHDNVNTHAGMWSRQSHGVPSLHREPKAANGCRKRKN